jgi:hypothetical protein
MEEKITFSKLSVPCKIGVIGGWVALVVYCIAFAIGFIEAMIGV